MEELLNDNAEQGMSLQQYKSHKMVRAAKIAEIEYDEKTHAYAILHFKGGGSANVSPSYIKKHDPKVDGYYVVYEDGYESWSPADAFEDGYSPAKENIFVIDPGHRYVLPNFENPGNSDQILQFIDKKPAEGGEKGELITINDGTTNESVLEMLIDRMNYLQDKFPCRENAIVIRNLEEALMWLEKRTSDRIKRKVEGKNIK